MPFIPNYADAGYSAQAEVDSVDFEIVLDGIEGYGVLSGCAVSAKSPETTAVAVASGSVKLGSSTVTVTAQDVSVPTGDATYPRFDLIYVDASGPARRAGTPSASPVFPSIPATSAILAAVYVPAGDSAVGTNQITDKRVTVPATATTAVATLIKWGNS